MRGITREEVDCDGCASAVRCWPEGTAPAAGFMVRRMAPLEAGEFLFRTGMAFEAPFVVTSGCVGLIETLDDGRERIIAFRVPGEIVGLEGVAAGAHRYCAQAIAPTMVCRLRWSPGNAVRSAALLRAVLSRTLAQSGPEVMPWPGRCATERVRDFVADFARRTSQPLPMTRAQIGSYLGMAEETVVRALKALRNNPA